LITAGCAGSDEAKQGQAGGQLAKAAEQAVQDAASGTPSNVKLVPHESLQALLPQLPGWERGEPKGETVTSGISVSRVTAEYDKGDSSLTFELMDTSMNQALLAPLMVLVKAGYIDRRSDGYTKATTVGGFPGTEEWTPEAKNGEVSALVGGRFVVKATGNSVANVGVIREAVEAIDLKKL